jgi:hypothetical protein
MQVPGYTAADSLPQSRAMAARISVGWGGWGGLGVMKNPDCYCVDTIWTCDGWVCYGACIRWVCP